MRQLSSFHSLGPMPLLVFVVSRRRDVWARLAAEPGVDVTHLESLDAFEPSGHGPEGLLLLDAETVLADDILSAARKVTEPGWCVAVLRRAEDDSWRVETLSLGFAETLEDAMAYARDPGKHPGRLLELRRVLREAGSLRHDVNNALTAGLAESELLLMDLEEGGTREAVGVIRHHLLRVRDQILAKGYLRDLPG